MKKKHDYTPILFLNMIDKYGVVNAVKRLVNSKKNPAVFIKLWECNALELSMEAIILEEEWKDLFSHEDRKNAQNRLTKFEYYGTDDGALSVFYCIVVRMHQDNPAKFDKPHLHVEYAEYQAVVAFDGEILEGSIPQQKMRLLEAWMEMYQDDLEANWKLLSGGKECFKIEPLK